MALDRDEEGPVGQVTTAILDAERRLRESYAQDVVAELQIADLAAGLLLAMLATLGGQTGKVKVDANGNPVSGDIRMLRLLALQLMGVKALRVIRAARSTLASGYEPESRVHDRILAELIEHRRAVIDDPTGAEAKAWLDGRRIRGIGRRVAESAPENLYMNLSADSHADPRPLVRMLDAERRVMSIEPRRTRATRASLLMHAGFARDQSAAIAAFAGIKLAGLPALDAAIEAGREALKEELDADAGAAA